MKPGDDGFVDVGAARDLRPGRGRAYRLGDEAVAVFRTEDGWVAIGDTCPHMGTSLADGPLENGRVECPWHHWRYDVTTGRSDARDWACVDVYDVRVEDGRVWLRPQERPAHVDESPAVRDDADGDEDWMRADPETFFKKPRP